MVNSLIKQFISGLFGKKVCWVGLEKQINQFKYKSAFLNHLTQFRMTVQCSAV